jgi:hypothetical protein
MAVPDSETVRNQRRELSTWQQIADYLGVSTRTAQIWERHQGLPVHRLRGEKSRVWSFTDELEAWRRKSAAAAALRQEKLGIRLWPWALAVVLLAAAGFTTAYFLTAPGAPARFETAGPLLTAFDANGRKVWSYSLPAATVPLNMADANHSHRHRGLFTDLDGDGKPELLFTYLPNIEPRPGGTMLCFGSTGKLLWSYRPGRVVKRVTGDEYSTYWDLAFTAALRKPRADGGRIIVASHHVYSWPAKVAVLDAAGKTVAEHWHPGWLFTGLLHDLDGDGQEEILLGGINNSYQSYRVEPALLVLDAGFSTGQSAPAPGDTRQIAGLPITQESALVLFPKLPFPGIPGRSAFVETIAPAGAFIEVKIATKPGASGQQTGLHYRFDRHLTCTNLTIDHSFDSDFAAGLPPPSLGATRAAQVTAALQNLLIPSNRFAAPTK